MRHRPWQHSEVVEQAWPAGLHCGQLGVPTQLASAQSDAPSQSLSAPSEHEDSGAGAPQSATQLHDDSEPAHVPSPQIGGGPQSSSHTSASSLSSHAPLPQQYDGSGVSLQAQPTAVHVELLHGSGFGPSPSPQQNRLFGEPVVWPRQSAAQPTQSSPPPASHTPLPHTAPGSLGQSMVQAKQSSPGVHSESPHTWQSGSSHTPQPA